MPTANGALHGVNLAGLEFSGKGSGAVIPGTLGTEYFSPNESEYIYYKSKGVTLIRLPFLWERLQPTLGGALDTAYLNLIKQNVTWAEARGMTVILDLHNYARYRVSGVERILGASDGVVTSAHLVDVWKRLATEFKGRSVWYGIMNEPHDMPTGFTARTIYYPFDSSTGGWTEETGSSVSISTTRFHSGTGSLTAAKTFGSGYEQVRFRGGAGAYTAGTFGAWVYLPATAPDTGWQAQIQYYDATYNTTNDRKGPAVTLTRGEWTPVTITPTLTADLPDIKDWIVQVWTNGANATVRVYLDAFSKGTVSTEESMWRTVTQSVVDAIRVIDANTRILVTGVAWSGAHSWRSHNENFIINGTNLVYEAHQYFDDDNSGTYWAPNGSGTESTYAQEGATATTGVSRVQGFRDWLALKGVKGFLGEYGNPPESDWLTVQRNFTAAIDGDANIVGSTYWAGGPNWGTYRMKIEPDDLNASGVGTDRPQMTVLDDFQNAAAQVYNEVGGTEALLYSFEGRSIEAVTMNATGPASLLYSVEQGTAGVVQYETTGLSLIPTVTGGSGSLTLRELGVASLFYSFEGGQSNFTMVEQAAGSTVQAVTGGSGSLTLVDTSGAVQSILEAHSSVLVLTMQDALTVLALPVRSAGADAISGELDQSNPAILYVVSAGIDTLALGPQVYEDLTTLLLASVLSQGLDEETMQEVGNQTILGSVASADLEYFSRILNEFNGLNVLYTQLGGSDTATMVSLLGSSQIGVTGNGIDLLTGSDFSSPLTIPVFTAGESLAGFFEFDSPRIVPVVTLGSDSIYKVEITGYAISPVYSGGIDIATFNEFMSNPLLSVFLAEGFDAGSVDDLEKVVLLEVRSTGFDASVLRKKSMYLRSQITAIQPYARSTIRVERS